MPIDSTNQHNQETSQSRSSGAPEESPTTPVGDGYDPEPLLTAEEVGAILKVPTKSVYELPIPRVRISRSRIRWTPADIRDFIERRLEGG